MFDFCRKKDEGSALRIVLIVVGVLAAAGAVALVIWKLREKLCFCGCEDDELDGSPEGCTCGCCDGGDDESIDDSKDDKENGAGKTEE